MGHSDEPQDKRTIAIDIEANGLDPDTIWCIDCQDLKTGETFFFRTQEEIHEKFPFFADTVKTWVGHNLIGYDVPVLHKLVKDLKEIKVNAIIDTLVLSRLANYSRTGGHSLEAWGTHLGYAKIAHEDWDSADIANQRRIFKRCRRDVEITVKVFNALREELRGFSKRSIRVEHETAAICEEVKRNGFYIDLPKAQALHDELLEKSTRLREQMVRELPPNRKLLRTAKIKYTKDGSVSQVTKNVWDNPNHTIELHDDNETYDVLVVTPFNPNSPSQCTAILDEAGWKPFERTKSGKSFKVNEANLNTLPETASEAVKSMRDYRIADSRYKVVRDWLESAERYGDGRVHGSLTHIGAGTHRMSHQDPNMANVPGAGSAYGHECRSCLTVPKGYKLLGTDAKGIQLRLLAHFMNDKNYIKEVLSGDPHTANLIAMGIDKGEWNEEEQQWGNRHIAKTFIYTWLMNGGNEKMGYICTGKLDKEAGKTIRQRFLNGIPSLKRFRMSHKQVAKRGYVPMFDGRRIKVDEEHYVMPTFLQGGESVVMKTALVLWYRKAKQLGIDFKLVAIVHDEWQTEVREDQAELLGRIQNNALRKAGELYKLNCPMEGDPKIGDNWADTH